MSPTQPRPSSRPDRPRGGLGQGRSRRRGGGPGRRADAAVLGQPRCGRPAQPGPPLLTAGVAEVGIERPDGPVIDALRQAGLVVFVIPPGQLKNLRSRYGSAGNKDDRFDAYVLADTVRTDRRRLRPLLIDTPATTALRQTVRARKDLVGHRVAVANQLRAHLQIVFPGAVGLFADIDSEISLRFLERFGPRTAPTGSRHVGWAAWLASVGYCGRTQPAILHTRLTGAPARPTGPDAATSRRGHHRVRRRTAHPHRPDRRPGRPDQPNNSTCTPTRRSSPACPAPDACAPPGLLAEIGDARGRFPTADSLACLAGVAPSTRQSGKVEVVSFRWGADKQLRDAICDFAGDSRHANPWAADLYPAPAPADTITRTPSASWPAPGSTSSGPAGPPTPPTTPTKHSALQRILNQDQPTAA